MTFYVTGIGSRKTPPNAIDQLEELGALVRRLGGVIRSGDAEGADRAWQRGHGSAELYLPREGWVSCFRPVAEMLHPNPEALRGYSMQLICRNIAMLTPPNGAVPSDACIGWCQRGRDGRPRGGTAFTMRAARHFGIPVLELNGDATYEEAEALIRRLARRHGA